MFCMHKLMNPDPKDSPHKSFEDSGVHATSVWYIDLMQLMSSPHITKCKTDSGWLSGYCAAILSAKMTGA